MSNHQEISSFIWNVCDDVLRGLFKQHEYGDVILPFILLRRLDCIIEPDKDKIIELYNELKDEVDPTPIIKKQTGLKFFNTSNFDLQRLKGDSSNLKVNFPNYINGYSQNVFEILENFQLEKPVEKLIKNNKLYLLIDKFTEVDLHPDKVDNHTMGQIFEELLRKFSEMSNETSGEHYTPRDVVKLLVSLVFSENEKNLEGEGIIRSIFDPCCGTGGMLTIGKDWIQENVDNKVRINLYGQELNPHTYSICKSDMLISGEDPDNINLGSSLSNDQFEGRKFDYMITNPPFGVSWKSEKDFIEEESKNPLGRFSVGTPRSTDGSLLFVQHLLSKMKDDGSRIGVVLSGSPLFSGGSGSGESEIRRWILENDYLECLVSLPDQLFFNTGIPTYIWILTNSKKKNRKGKVQLIDGSIFFESMRKSLGSKRKIISKKNRDSILDIFKEFKENEYCKIFDNEHFGYTKVTVERPKIENGKVVLNKNGTPKPDSLLRINEFIPLSEDIDKYFHKNIKSKLTDSWMNRGKDSVGYEITFKKYFKNHINLRESKSISSEFIELENKRNELYNELFSHTIKESEKTKYSGNDIIGNIPENWDISRIKYEGGLFGGLTGKKGDDFNNEDNLRNRPFIPFTNIFNNTYISKEHFQLVNIEDNENQNLVRKNDLFFLMSSEGYDDLGKSSILIEDVEELYLNSFCKGYRITNKKILPVFLNYQLLGSVHRQLISIEGNGFTRINLRQDKLNDTIIFIPSPKEQQKIVDFIDSMTLKINEFIDLEEKRLELLKDYRNSLMSELVVGKVSIEL